MAMKIYPQPPLIRGVEGKKEEAPSALSNSLLAELLSEIKRISQHYYNGYDVQFDYITNSIVVLKNSTVLTDIFTVPEKFQQAIVKGLGLWARDATSLNDCQIVFKINGAVVPGYQYSSKTFTESPFDFTHPTDVFIRVPKNAIFQIEIKNTNTVNDYKFKVRAKGWFE